MTEISEHVKDYFSNMCINNKACEFDEKNGVFTFECIYQRTNYRFITHNLNKVLLKFVVNLELQIGITIIELQADKDINSTVIGIKKSLEDRLYSILKTNIYSEIVAGNHILLTWHLPITNVEEADQAIDGVKKIRDYILRKYTFTKRGTLNI